jgi:cell wall assembly regulator SMI1
MNDAIHSDFWHRIDSVLERYAPPVFQRFQPPATRVQIEKAENAMGARLPDEVRAAFLRHNGCRSYEPGNLFSPANMGSVFVSFYEWCGLELMVERWQWKKARLEADRLRNPEIHEAQDSSWDELQVRQQEWNLKWLPIGLNNTRTALYIDMDPAAQGTAGQLIYSNGSEATLYAPGFNQYFASIATGLEAGLIKYDDEGFFSGLTGSEEVKYFFQELLVRRASNHC